jgi:hypothetical protein
MDIETGKSTIELFHRGLMKGLRDIPRDFKWQDLIFSAHVIKTHRRDLSWWDTTF